jgi:hypothetical protein
MMMLMIGSCADGESGEKPQPANASARQYQRSDRATTR